MKNIIYGILIALAIAYPHALDAYFDRDMQHMEADHAISK